jgi:hypothetical protein
MLLVLSDEYHMVYHLFFSLILRQQEQKMTNEYSRVLKDVEKKKSRLESEYYGCTRKF